MFVPVIFTNVQYFHLFLFISDRIMSNEDRDNLVRVYYMMGMKYVDIVSALAAEHGLIISERHLKRILKTQGLFRRDTVK